MEADETIKKWLEGSLTGPEKQAFEQTEDFRQLQRMLAATRHFKAPDFAEDLAFERLLEARQKTAAPTAKQAWLSPVLRLAAMVILAAGGIFYWFYNPATEISTRLAEHQITYLPDSTQITLNAATTVRYQARRWKQNREVALEGEAFFDVRKGSSFTVKTRLGDVTVLGTRFNVRLRAGRFEVTCYEGSVLVRVEQAERTLEPGMKLEIRNNQPVIESGEVGQAPSWLNQESAFESAPLGEVLEELERQYGISVSTRNVDTTKLFSGRFSHQDLNVALESIAFPMHLTFKISPNRKNVEFSGEIP